MTTAQDEHDTKWETAREQGETLLTGAKELVHKGNVRRVLVKNRQGNTVAQLTVTAAIIIAIIAPAVAILFVIVALVKEWSIRVETTENADDSKDAGTAGEMP
jgi:hypothetical protein